LRCSATKLSAIVPADWLIADRAGAFGGR